MNLIHSQKPSPLSPPEHASPIMDPTPRPVPPYAKSEGSLHPSDPLAVERPPAPGLGSLHSRQTHASLDEFRHREAARHVCFWRCLGGGALLLTLAGLLLFFLFPRPPSVTTGPPTVTLSGAPTPASFSALFSVVVTADNSASFVPWTLASIEVQAFNQFSNEPMVKGGTVQAIVLVSRTGCPPPQCLPASLHAHAHSHAHPPSHTPHTHARLAPQPMRDTKSFVFSLVVSTAAAANANQVALLSCAQAILDASGCSVRLQVTGTPTYLGIKLSPRTFDTSIVIP